VAVLLFLGVDLVIVQALPAGAVLVPLIVVAVAMTVSVAVMAIAGVVLLPGAGLKGLLKAALYLSIQRWYLSLAMLVLLGIMSPRQHCFSRSWAWPWHRRRCCSWPGATPPTPSTPRWAKTRTIPEEFS
jgi:hypothetical protein